MDKKFEGWEEKAKETFEGFTSEGYSEEKLHKVLDNEEKSKICSKISISRILSMM